MKDKSNKIFIMIILLVNIIFMFSLIISKKALFSEEENRYLEKFSVKKINEYITDHFPFRNKFIALKNKTQKKIGKTYINDIYLGKDEYLIPSFNDNYNKHYLINALNNFSNKYPITELMIVPDSTLINNDKLIRYNGADQEKEIKYLYQKVKTKNINLINYFLEENKNNQLYYKTDHHWTTKGAYKAYVFYCKEKNIPFYKEEDFNIKEVSNDFLGTSSSKVYGLANKESIYIYDTNNKFNVEYVLEKKITESLYNLDYLNKKDKYALFLDNNHALIKITNESINTDNNILIIKNSYANAFIPFIANHYKEIYVIDMRYYNNMVSDFVEENKIDNILILYNLNNLYSDLSLVKLK
ncbi:MAG: hypothetical protein GX951_00755 [Mollicutes bacterium]|nr:hypothetical protein [Mollicutes bacterium]